MKLTIIVTKPQAETPKPLLVAFCAGSPDDVPARVFACPGELYPLTSLLLPYDLLPKPPNPSQGENS